MIAALLLLALILLVLVQAPRTDSLAEEERMLREYFRRVDRGEE